MTSTSTLLTESEAAPLLRVSKGTLRVWRCQRRYPLRFVRIGSKIFYTREGIEEFIRQRTDPGVAKTPAPRKGKRAAA
jgi:hypothetical protein